MSTEFIADSTVLWIASEEREEYRLQSERGNPPYPALREAEDIGPVALMED